MREQHADPDLLDDLIAETIYANDDDHASPATTLANPFTTGTDGKYEFYLDSAVRVDVKIVTPGGQLQDVTRTLDVNRTPNNARHVIVDESTSLTDRQTLRFTGAGVTAADDAANGRTNVTIPGGVTDHGALDGLADDDHPQYVKDSEYSAKGVILAGTGVGTFAAETVGANGLALVADSAEANSVKWAAVGRLLDTTEYNPGTSTVLSTTSTTFAVIDATNLTLAFTAPASGNVLVRLTAHAAKTVGTTERLYLWAIYDGTTFKQGVRVHQTASTNFRQEASAVLLVTGLTPGTAYTFTWRHKVSGDTHGIIVGGNVATSVDEGPALMEVWEA